MLHEWCWLTFRVLADGELWAFRSLPFGWSYSPVICQAVLEDIVRRVALEDVLVLIYYDDIFVIGYGSHHVGHETGALGLVLKLHERLSATKAPWIPD